MKHKLIICICVIIFISCSRNEVIFSNTDEGVGYDVNLFDVMPVEDIKKDIQTNEVENDFEDTGSDAIDILSIDGDANEVGWCGLPDGAELVNMGELGVLDGYDYPDYWYYDDGNRCGEGNLEKEFEEEWNIKINGLLNVPSNPVFAYHEGRLFTVMWGGMHDWDVSSYFTVVNEKGEIIFYERGYSWYSAPVVDDNGDVYFSTVDGHLLVYKKMEDSLYSGNSLYSFPYGYECKTIEGAAYISYLSPVIGRDGTVYAYLKCSSKLGIFEKIVGFRSYKKVFELDIRELREIYGDSKIGFDFTIHPMISSDDKLIIGLLKECIGIGVYSKIIFVDNMGRIVREFPWREGYNGYYGMVYNTPETFFTRIAIMNDKFEIIKRINLLPHSDISAIVTTVNGGIITPVEKEVDNGTFRFNKLVRYDKEGNVMASFEAPAGEYIAPYGELSNSNIVYLSNDGVLLPLIGAGENKKVRIFVLNENMEPIWIEERDKNPSYGGSSIFLLPECGKLFVSYADFLKEDDRDLPPTVQYQFKINSWIGPGKSTWPMRRGDAQNTGRVQLYK